MSANASSRTPRVAVLVSGGGRSLENLAQCVARGELDIELALVISNTPRSFALERARRLNVPSVVIDHREFSDPAAFGAAIFAAVEERGCELVVLAGFLRLLPIPDAWERRVINIHPALLPKFGGRGFYGDHVHRAVLEAREAETGCTVHYVTNEYDRGATLLQRRIAVRPDDDVHSLGARVFEEEKVALPEAIRRHFAAVSPSMGGDSPSP